MRHNRNTFYRELAPLADKIRAMGRATPAPLSVAKDYHACQAKQAAKRARRALREATRQAAKP